MTEGHLLLLVAGRGLGVLVELGKELAHLAAGNLTTPLHRRPCAALLCGCGAPAGQGERSPDIGIFPTCLVSLTPKTGAFFSWSVLEKSS